MKHSRLFLAFILVLFLAPLAVLILYSISAAWSYPELVPRSFSLRAVEFLWIQRVDLLLSIGSSLAYSLLTVLLTLSMCLLPASVFAYSNFKMKNLLEALFLAPALLPSMTFAIGVHTLFIITGISDTLLGIVLVLATFSYPYMLRALVAGYQSFSRNFNVCARNLGGGFWFSLFHIDIPMLLPAMVAGGTVVFLVAFSEYFLVFLVGGGAVPSFTGYLFPFLRSSDNAIASILTLVFLVIPIALFIGIDSITRRIYEKRNITG